VVQIAGERARSAAGVLAGVFYVATVGLAAALLLLVGDHTLAVALVALEASMVTATHLARRRRRSSSDAAAPSGGPTYDPTLPVLDRPGHGPADRRGTWSVLAGMIGVIAAVAVLVSILSATTH
jgi:hypothetical protein